LKQKLAELNCLQSEIDELRAATGTPQQILLKIKVIEISRTKLRQSGIDIGLLRNGDGGKPLAQAPVESARFAGFTTIDDTAAVVELVERLRKNNIAKVLTEPTLVAVSGRPASFNVGGEVPLPLPKGSQQAVENKPIGTQVDLLAVAKGDNRVQLELRARVGELDGGRNIIVDGVSVPSFSVTQVHTRLDLRIGQTGVHSGMLERRTERQKRGDQVVDVENEIDLLLLVTPELVAPLDHSQQASARGAAAYRTATSGSEERPGERSLRVTKPYKPR
jgi:pilus assembly protein CpaC